jgi:hypothetical protein
MIVVPGVMGADLGPGDVCGIAADGATFDFALSAQSAALALDPIASVMARSEIEPFIFDLSDPFPIACP